MTNQYYIRHYLWPCLINVMNVFQVVLHVKNERFLWQSFITETGIYKKKYYQFR